MSGERRRDICLDSKPLVHESVAGESAVDRLKVFCVGGTIDKVYFDAISAYQVGEPQVVAIFEGANVCFSYEIVPLMRKDSLEMTDDDRASLRDAVAQDPSDKILITHGTDTMVLTAEALADIPGKTIVLTGAMAPARFRDSDATFNIGFAVGALAALQSGTYVAMNGKVFPAGHVRKNREAGRFEATRPSGEKVDR